MVDGVLINLVKQKTLTVLWYEGRFRIGNDLVCGKVRIEHPAGEPLEALYSIDESVTAPIAALGQASLVALYREVAAAYKKDVGLSSV